MKTKSRKIFLTVDVVGRYELEIEAESIKSAQDSLSFAWPPHVRVLWSDENIEIAPK